VQAWGGKWSRCPVGIAESDPLWAEATHLTACARLSPLSDWPDGYSAGVVGAMMMQRAEQDREEARAIESARGS